MNEMIKPENSEIASKITVAIITSSTRKEDYDQTIQYPMVKGYLQKPIMIEHLKEELGGNNDIVSREKFALWVKKCNGAYVETNAERNETEG